VASSVAACGVTQPSDLKNQVFVGSVAPGGVSNTAFFSTSKTGEFIVKVGIVSPDSGATFTAIYGQPAGASCGVLGSAPAGQGKTAFDQQLPKGDYCFQMIDPTFALPQTENFTVTISYL
jgi:hypothetical protein